MIYIVIAIFWIISILVSFYFGKRSLIKTLKNAENLANNYMEYYYLLSYWLEVKQKKKNIEDYFSTKNYKNIIVYGYGPIGKRFVEELRGSNVNICLIVDGYLTTEETELNRFEELYQKEADAVVVTAVYHYNIIKKQIENRVKCPIISLCDVVYSM